ncbi:hypothetical protein BpHYR1_053591 [Brachionus plicatilis]|uniref:Uncharacterized protein n=1 Tax=Brachionus plicatilis TaxID=10195 RepID=A0A3M7QV08_BRAPC|nr:hypothetical protein BpHYR1_053591 [Brachionus plicatilis]
MFLKEPFYKILGAISFHRQGHKHLNELQLVDVYKFKRFLNWQSDIFKEFIVYILELVLRLELLNIYSRNFVKNYNL